MPEPNVSCGFDDGSFVMSNVSGASNTSGSRLAVAADRPRKVSFGNSTSLYSMSSLANRAVPRTVPK